jgi:nitrogen fixation protein NifU and related proteins
MSDLRELYQQVILDHYKNPRNYRKLETANRTAEGYNPLCGDHYTFFVEVDGERVKDIGFQGSGCAISKASASMMSSMVKGKSREEVAELTEVFRNLVTTGRPGEGAAAERFAPFAGVAEHPSRVKCAVLAWHTLRSALEGKESTVSTE